MGGGGSGGGGRGGETRLAVGRRGGGRVDVDERVG